MRDAFTNRPTTLADYLAILRRRIWVIVLPLVLAPVAAVVFTSRQEPVYQGHAVIFLKRANIGAALTGVTDPTLQVDPKRLLGTQAVVARDPELARRVVAVAGVPGETPDALLGALSISPQNDLDLLDFFVSDRDPGVATRLTNAYATEYTKYQTESDRQLVSGALKEIRARMKSLRARGIPSTAPAFGPLFQSESALVTVGATLANNLRVVQPAERAKKISPRPQRNGILAGLLGGIIGIGLAFLAEALDRRVRSEHEIEDSLDLPLVARLPKPPRKLRKANQLVMLAEPAGIQAEGFRKLRTNIEFVTLERQARSIMVTSAGQREGKSTTVANLAVAFARAGRRVALVDLDLRRPFLNNFFGFGNGVGLTDVVIGRLKLEEAMRTIALTSTRADSFPARRANGRHEAMGAPLSTNGRSQVEGVLSVLPAGTIPPDPGEFVHTEGVSAVLDQLAAEFEFVFVDAPPLLAVDDAMTLSAKVDAMFVVTRLTMVQRPLLHELGRQLRNCPAEKLGFVLTGAELGEGYWYGYAYGYTPAKAERGEQPVA